MTKYYSGRNHSYVHGFASGKSLSCSFCSALPHSYFGFVLLRAPAAERNTIYFAIMPFLQNLAAN
jgi:hypothetical protein